MIKIKSLIVLSIFSLFFVSCEQEFNNESMPKSIGNVPIIRCNYSVKELSLNDEDKYDEQVNNELIKASLLLKNIVKEKMFSEVIGNEIKSNGYLKLHTLT